MVQKIVKDEGKYPPLVQEGIRRNHQYRGVRRDGTTFFGEISAAVIRDAAGNPEAMMGVYRDITERKRGRSAVQRMPNCSRQQKFRPTCCPMNRRNSKDSTSPVGVILRRPRQEITSTFYRVQTDRC